MTRESMIDLVIMHDEIDNINKLQELLIGKSFALGYGEGILGRFSRVCSIIRRECNQSLVNPELDIEDNEYYKILKSNMSITEKADALLDKN
jgi:hypothetical protein